MKTSILALTLSIFMTTLSSQISAQTNSASIAGVLDASPSGIIATPSAITVLTQADDLTETRGEVKGKLERFLDEKPPGSLSIFNPLQHSIRYAVSHGVPINTVVLLLLFPVVAMMVAASRHLLGLRGFGIYIPAVLSVAFVATGFVPGIILFLIILSIATYALKGLKKFKLQYLPRMALVIWLVSLGVLATILISPRLDISELSGLNIFPILILILLAENFNEVQMGKSQREATELTLETMVLALISALFMSLELVQRFALLYPEALLLITALINIAVGRYSGLRFTEYLRFKKLLE